jgi:pheromone shutdown protein TraB
MEDEMALDEASSGYPVSVTYVRAEKNQRFWAIPVLGIVAKLIILIPHLIILYVLRAVVQLVQLILWIPVLFGGHYPLWGYALVGGTIRWTTRVSAFLLGLTDEYPPFTFRSADEDGRDFQVQVRMQIPPHHNRFWAAPLLGIAIKLLILIPHLIILYVLSAVVSIVVLVLWIWVLFGGRYPSWGYQLVGGTIRWSTRVLAYIDGLTDRYPPFSFE